jgi:two-component system, cell cycle sensor histidine kinase and response regulator CckA
MKAPLHILHLEDDLNDAFLIQSALATGGIDCTIARVQNQTDFVAALNRGGVDLILSDYTLPTFNGLAALKIARTGHPGLPVILVSGTLGEERAVEALKQGATDFVLKRSLPRLIPAVHRAMQEVEERAGRLRLEAQFIEAQKMEVIGQLASGVAHDFNNILAVIIGYSDLGMERLPPDDVIRGHLETIRSSAERAAGLTRQLLIFSRKQTVHPVVLDLNEVVRDLDKMLRRLIDENIEMKIVTGTALGRVKADSGYVGQVVMNMVVNARDAMPNGGQLTIATQNARLDQYYAPSHHGAISGDFVMLSVIDTGAGMTEDVKAHIFEAFFTTKPKGQGTGLGLATCQSIVQQSNGYIGVDSELGKGTTFKVYFPRVQQPLEAAAKAAQAGPLPHGTETLLVVEDEPSVRRLACRVLEALGYKVLSASNGQDALHVARDYQGPPIRLVVTDVIMPLMGGKVMAEWLKTAQPGLKILFTSGYSDEAITLHGVFEAGVAFLPKPYAPGDLARRVREMLDAGPETMRAIQGSWGEHPIAPAESI